MINSCIGSIILSCGGGIKSVPDSLVTFVPNLVFVTFAPFNLYVNVEKGAQKTIDILNTIRTCKQSLSTIHFCSICVCVCVQPNIPTNFPSELDRSTVKKFAF